MTARRPTTSRPATARPTARCSRLGRAKHPRSIRLLLSQAAAARRAEQRTPLRPMPVSRAARRTLFRPIRPVPAERRMLRLRVALLTRALQRARWDPLSHRTTAHTQATPRVASIRPGTLWWPAPKAVVDPLADRRTPTTLRAAEAPRAPLVLQPTIT